MCLSENVSAGKISKLLSCFVLFFFLMFLSFDYVCIYEFVHMSAVPVETEKAIGSLGAGVTGGCGPPDMGAGEMAWQAKVLTTKPNHLSEFVS